MSEEAAVKRNDSGKRWAVIAIVVIVIGAVPLGLLGLWVSESAGLSPAQREEAIAALLIEDESGTLRLTSLLLTPENADRPVAGEVGLTLEVERAAGPYFGARETRTWRTEYTIDPNYRDRLPTGNDVWGALLARFAREHDLARGEAAAYLNRADGTESRILWPGIIANGALLGFALLVIVALEVQIMKLVRWGKGPSTA